MDLVEVNEAFAPQYLAVEKELGLDRAKTNVHGGAIAIGHPLAATGTRVTIHLLHALRRAKQRFGLAATDAGVAMDIAVTVVLGTLALYLFGGLKVLREYERAVYFFLGRSWGAKGPGLIYVPPHDRPRKK